MTLKGRTGILSSSRVAASSFVPTDIANCVLWYDPSDSGTVTSSGGFVTALNDKSGNARHTAASGGERPKIGTNTLNGRNVLTLDAGGMSLTHDAGSDAIDLEPLTMFAIVRAQSPLDGASRRFVSARRDVSGSDFNPPNFLAYRTNATSAVNLDAFGSGASIGSGFATVAAATWAVAVVRATSAVISARWGNGTAGSRGANAAIAAMRYVRIGGNCGGLNPPSINAAETWLGDMAEVVAYAADLSGADETTVKDYLAAKWSVSL